MARMVITFSSAALLATSFSIAALADAPKPGPSAEPKSL
jgi:hypothetical protein